MSTDFRPLDPIRMADLFDGRLEGAGVHERHSDGTGFLRAETNACAGIGNDQRLLRQRRVSI